VVIDSLLRKWDWDTDLAPGNALSGDFFFLARNSLRSEEVKAKEPPQNKLNKLNRSYMLQECQALKDFEIGCRG